ncbi:zinc ribbon domain-containing protein [bacterium D16-51]|nr:zinc ribbon domain-containing protein [bacterium D16-59]RKI55821.1 zinc ribbon domain-containing protein [bacterium D16-51]
MEGILIGEICRSNKRRKYIFVGKISKFFCSNCGKELRENEKYCPNCGHKIPLDIDNHSLKVRGFKRKLSLKKVTAICAVFLMIIVLFLAGKMFIPQIFVSTSDLLAEGNYEKAYSKAKKDQKDDVLVENLISYECKEAANGLKDPSSFQLREVWYDKGNSRFVLSISGKNGMGGAASGYWYYKYSEEEKEYQLITVINDLDEEDYSYFDDTEDKLEKIFNNMAREAIKDIIYQKDNELDNSIIKNINGLHKKDILQDVELLDEINEIYPKGKVDNA